MNKLTSFKNILKTIYQGHSNFSLLLVADHSEIQKQLNVEKTVQGEWQKNILLEADVTFLSKSPGPLR